MLRTENMLITVLANKTAKLLVGAGEEKNEWSCNENARNGKVT